MIVASGAECDDILIGWENHFEYLASIDLEGISR
jgi:hypothetical protein